ILAPHFWPARPDLRGTRTVGYTFFEENLLAPANAAASTHFDWIATGSNWCTDLLRAQGMTNVSTVWEGVDRAIFSPALADKQMFRDSFVVFNGGKFEHRKSQDIVIRAFKVLHDRHPDVLLVNAWTNPSLKSFATMSRSPLIAMPSSLQGSFKTLVQEILAM